MVDLRDRCKAAFERGHQLWPAASNAEYRLALDAPARWAAGMLTAGAGRFALGPMPEVVASTHAWVDLAPHAAPTPEAAMAAHERVVRGEDLTGDDRVAGGVLELPLKLQEWEPAYATAIYRADEVELPDVPAPRLEEVALPAPGAPVADQEAVSALVELAVTWQRESNGSVEAVAVDGDALAAIAALDLERARVAQVDSPAAIALMAWTAASGGAHGRRKGAATGRFSAWWTLAALGGVLDDWPFESDEIGDTASALEWYRWEPSAPPTGWWLGLAIADPETGRAWTVRARDRV